MAKVGDLLVKVRADVKDLNTKMDAASKKVSRSQKRMQKSFKNTNKVSKAFQNRMSNTATAIAALQGPLGPMAGRMRSFGALMGSAGFMAGALILALAAVAAAFRFIVKAASNAEQAMVKFEALVKSTQMAAGLTADSLEEMARRMARDTLFSVSEMRDAMGVMLTFKEVAGSAFERSMAVATDMAQVLGTDVKSSVLQLGKALEAPEIGLSMLRRSGISFTQAQKDVIISLTRTGEKGKALDMILGQIEAQLGGTAKAAAGDGSKVTLAGAFDELSRKFILFQEELLKGTTILGKFAQLVMKIADLIPALDVIGMKDIDLRAELNNSRIELEKMIAMTDKMDFSIFGVDALPKHQEAIAKLKKDIEDITNEINRRIEAQKRLAKTDEEQKTLKWELTLAYKAAEKSAKAFFNVENSRMKTLGLYGADLKIVTQQEKMLNAERKKGVILTAEQEQSIRDLIEVNRELIEKNEFITEAYGHVESAVNKAFGTMENSIIGLIKGTKSLKDVLRNIMQQFIADMTTSIIKMLVLNRLKEAIMGSVGKSLNLGSIFNMFTGGPDISGVRAQGGTVASKTPYIVGEKGPELFIPNTSGRVAPNGSFGGGGGAPPVVVEQHINFATGIQPTVRAEVMNLLPQIQNSTIAAVQEARVRGGKFAESFGG